MFFLIISVLVFPLFCGFLAVIIWGKPCNKRHSAVVIHSVPSKPVSHLSAFPCDRFSKFCELLEEKGFDTATVKEYTEGQQENKVLITFDDGFEDIYTNALPVLQRHDMTATVFVVSGFIGKSSTWDTLSPRRHLNKNHIRSMHSLGIEIASHTVTHPNLCFLSDKEIRSELMDSKYCLEEVIGAPICSISFPFGHWNRRIWHIAKECGYKCGTLYRWGRERPKELVPVWGAYMLDNPKDLLEKINPSRHFSISRAQSRILPSFSKGTPVWNYRQSYNIRF